MARPGAAGLPRHGADWRGEAGKAWLGKDGQGLSGKIRHGRCGETSAPSALTDQQKPLEDKHDLDKNMARPRKYSTESERREARRAQWREYARRNHDAIKKDRHSGRRRVAVLDFETEPFDNKSRARVEPFCAVLYYGGCDYHTFWNNDPLALIDEIVERLKGLPPSLIYAHNGGRFDFFFFARRMGGKITMRNSRILQWFGFGHEFRDSYALIPAPLAAFQKEKFDYAKCKAENREKHRDEILDYCLSDCAYTLSVIERSHSVFGRRPLTIGAAAKNAIERDYPSIDNITSEMDSILRPYFKGGRVDCLQGCGIYSGEYHCYDVNSMYPYVMATYSLPIGSDDTYIALEAGKVPDPEWLPCFVDVTCASNGAFPFKEKEITSYPIHTDRRPYRVTWPEYEMAKRLGLIRDDEVHRVIYSAKHTTFDRFIRPRYAERQKLVNAKKSLQHASKDYIEADTDQLLVKLLLNNAFGKFAQNPDRYRDRILVDEYKPWGWEIDEQFIDPTNPDRVRHLISRETKMRRFYNVGTAAMVTGYARAYLMEIIHRARDVIYCDTDSIICRDAGDVEIDGSRLGALKHEWAAREVGILCKKVYYAIDGDGREVKIKAKGHNADDLNAEAVRTVLTSESGVLKTVSKAPKFQWNGDQLWIERTLRVTAPRPHVVAAARAEWERVYGES